MPLSSLTDPLDLAAPQSLLHGRTSSHRLLLGSDKRERWNLAYIAASLAPLALDEDELAQRAVIWLREKD